VPLSRTPQPDFVYLHGELKRRGVTRMLLWQEYKATHPDGWQYSVFCDAYRRWLARQEIVLRQEHLPGDKGFVDYAGQTVPIVDRLSGEVRHPGCHFAGGQCFLCTHRPAQYAAQGHFERAVSGAALEMGSESVW
jgi:transposase